MPEYAVHVTIENKAGISDPEGETILRDLILRETEAVRSVRTAKMLKIMVDAGSVEEASETVRRLCDGARIYNPLVSTVSIDVLAG